MNRIASKSLPAFGIVILLSACAGHKHTVEGGVIGGAAGGALGAIIGDQSDHTAEGAILGAVIGGAAGSIIGNQMDKQAAELRADLDGATVTRVGEGIKITFDSGLLFAVDQSTVTSTAGQNLTELAETLNKYDDTEILIEGHTDADGTDEHNQQLSKERAERVAAYLERSGVKASRFTTIGYGESQPVEDNGTVEGKAKNRRVEIAIYANKKMQRAAERGEIGDLQ